MLDWEGLFTFWYVYLPAGHLLVIGDFGVEMAGDFCLLRWVWLVIWLVIWLGWVGLGGEGEAYFVFVRVTGDVG